MKKDNTKNSFNLFREIGLFFKSIFVGFSFICAEIYYMIYSFLEGVVYIFQLLFKEIPIFLFGKVSKWFYNTFSKDAKKKVSDESSNDLLKGRKLSKVVGDFIKEKYNNIPFIKKKNEELEARLKVLVVDQDGKDAVKTEKKHTYRYLARNKEGKLIKGYFPALSKLDVYSYLIDEGHVVYEIETSKSIDFLHGDIGYIRNKMANKDLIFWLTQISTYIKAGIPLAEAVKIIAKQDKKKKYKGVYDSVIYELTMGNTFSEALKKQGNVFPPLLVNMVKSSEMIGNIEETLDQMSDYYQEQENNKKAIISALTYPAIILVFAVIVVIFMLIKVIPEFQNVYSSLGSSELPKITQMVLNISSYLIDNWKSIILVIASIIFIFSFTYKKLKSFRTFVQYCIMHIPVIGKMIIYKEIALFAKTFSTLNKNNVLLADSIEMLRKITSNEIFKAIMFKTINNLLVGEKMSISFKDHWAVPDIAYYMIVTGESTGELSLMLEKVADYYSKLQKNTTEQMKTFIEPVMIALLAVIVGVILIAVLLPMMGVYSMIA